MRESRKTLSAEKSVLKTTLPLIQTLTAEIQAVFSSVLNWRHSRRTDGSIHCASESWGPNNKTTQRKISKSTVAKAIELLFKGACKAGGEEDSGTPGFYMFNGRSHAYVPSCLAE